MKIQFRECDGCYAIELQAETMAEAAQLTRFGLNHTKEIRHSSAVAFENGEFNASVVLGKRRKPTDTIPQAR